ncbi:MAG: hypothetical protein H6807_14030 [Planctomycetes bacterium]|nr:hypothetical protein [Planctomycetota bacterium]
MTKSGPCKTPPIAGQEFCRWHDPALEEERKAASRRGGQMRSMTQDVELREELPEDLKSIRALTRLLEAAIHGLWKDRIEPKKATALGGLVKTLRDLLIDLDLEERVARLEAALEGRHEARP